MQFSNVFKEILKQRDINASQLAGMIGFTPQHVHDLLNGDRRWNEDTINKTCEALGLIIIISEKTESTAISEPKHEIPEGMDIPYDVVRYLAKYNFTVKEAERILDEAKEFIPKCARLSGELMTKDVTNAKVNYMSELFEKRTDELQGNRLMGVATSRQSL